MPRSRNRVNKGGRKAHNKAVNNRNLLKQKEEEKQRKLFMDQLMKAQQDALENQQADVEVVDADDMGDIGDLSDIGLDDIQVDTEPEITENKS